MRHRMLKAALVALALASHSPAAQIPPAEAQYLQTLAGVSTLLEQLTKVYKKGGEENRLYGRVAADLAGSCARQLGKTAPPPPLESFHRQMLKVLEVSGALYSTVAVGATGPTRRLATALETENEELRRRWREVQERYQ